VQVRVEAFQVRMPVPEATVTMVFTPLTCEATAAPVTAVLV
jgi:hypothetical protein